MMMMVMMIIIIIIGSTPKKFRRVCMEFSNHNATMSKTICPEMLIFGK